ncbi:MAG: nitrate/nitrite transporter NrtS [Ilumatobacteraceae bacterium]|nr:nitrate/nitrite transporter NrtS [Ilumatobacteraceae bacterium]
MTEPTAGSGAVPPVPAWSSVIEGARLILSGVTFRTGSRVALVVGTILTLVNQGSVITGGDATSMNWVKIGVNYLVPFIVSSIGYIAPFRVRKGVT